MHGASRRHETGHGAQRRRVRPCDALRMLPGRCVAFANFLRTPHRRDSTVGVDPGMYARRMRGGAEEALGGAPDNGGAQPALPSPLKSREPLPHVGHGQPDAFEIVRELRQSAGRQASSFQRTAVTQRTTAVTYMCGFLSSDETATCRPAASTHSSPLNAGERSDTLRPSRVRPPPLSRVNASPAAACCFPRNQSENKARSGFKYRRSKSDTSKND